MAIKFAFDLLSSGLDVIVSSYSKLKLKGAHSFIRSHYIAMVGKESLDNSSDDLTRDGSAIIWDKIIRLDDGIFCRSMYPTAELMTCFHEHGADAPIDLANGGALVFCGVFVASCIKCVAYGVVQGLATWVGIIERKVKHESSTSVFQDDPSHRVIKF